MVYGSETWKMNTEEVRRKINGDNDQMVRVMSDKTPNQEVSPK